MLPATNNSFDFNCFALAVQKKKLWFSLFNMTVQRCYTPKHKVSCYFLHRTFIFGCSKSYLRGTKHTGRVTGLVDKVKSIILRQKHQSWAYWEASIQLELVFHQVNKTSAMDILTKTFDITHLVTLCSIGPFDSIYCSNCMSD